MPYWFDGNNLIGQSSETARTDSRVRQSFLSVLSTYSQAGGGRFLVYFDGDDPNCSLPPRGVAVRYSAPLSADESIVRRLQEIRHPSEVIVVTNDRNLRVRCRNAKAKTMTWQEFAAKMKTRSLSPKRQKEKETEVDVEDWLRYFGLDNTSNS